MQEVRCKIGCADLGTFDTAFLYGYVECSVAHTYTRRRAHACPFTYIQRQRVLLSSPACLRGRHQWQRDLGWVPERRQQDLPLCRKSLEVHHQSIGIYTMSFTTVSVSIIVWYVILH